MRLMTWAGLAVSVIFLCGIATVLALADLRPAFAALLWVGLAFSILGAIIELRQLRHPLPALRLDAQGVEGAFGRLAWGGVRAISIEARLDGAGFLKPLVVLHLTGRIHPTSNEGHWAPRAVFHTSTSASEVHLQLWGRRATVLRDLERFCSGAIG